MSSSSPALRLLNSYPKSKSRENRKEKGMIRSPFFLKISEDVYWENVH